MEGTHLRVRVNVTCAGTLVALTEEAAVVQLPRPQPPDRQTTLAIENEGHDTVYIPARVVRTEPRGGPAPAGREHHVFVEFLELSEPTAAAVRRLIEGMTAVGYGLTA